MARYFVRPEADILQLKQAILERRLVLFHGPRQSGKTTCLKFLIEEMYRDHNITCRYVSLQDVFCKNLQDDDAIHSHLNLVDGQRVLLIDEFDMLHPYHFAFGTIDKILHRLRSWNDVNGMPIICAGSFASTTLKSSGPGSPFNTGSKYLIKPFSRDDLTELFKQFHDDYKVTVDSAVLDEILLLTNGHRALVNHAGKSIQTAVVERKFHRDSQFTKDNWQELCRQNFISSVGASTIFTSPRSELNKLHPASVRKVFLQMSDSKYQRILDFATETWNTIVTPLIDQHVLCTDDDGKTAYVGVPVMSELFRELKPELRPQWSAKEVLQEAITLALTDVCYTFSNGARKSRDSDSQIVPREMAYEAALAHILNLLFKRSVICQPKPGENIVKRVDMLCPLRIGQEPAVIEFVAHERVGSVTRSGSVLEHIARMKDTYMPAHPKAPSYWVVNFALKDVQPDQQHIKDPAINVMHVFHTLEDWTPEFVCHLAGLCIFAEPTFTSSDDYYLH